ncbi:MAG TPA: hypothetical protein VFF52_03105 [Isosphaeraceae bacterium]|nr:hypothetical protein [Isosphaeraceae bacterium]
MSTVSKPRPPKPAKPEPDPDRYGWRYVRVVAAHGTEMATRRVRAAEPTARAEAKQADAAARRADAATQRADAEAHARAAAEQRIRELEAELKRSRRPGS